MYELVSPEAIGSKTRKRIVLNFIYKNFSEDKLLRQNQVGLRPTDQGLNLLLLITIDIYNSFDDYYSLEVRNMFLNMP